MHDQYCILYDHLFQELQSLKEENSKLRNMRSDMDDELHQLTENLFEVCVCVCACVAVNCESESTWRVILLLPSALSSHFPPSLLPPPHPPRKLTRWWTRQREGKWWQRKDLQMLQERSEELRVQHNSSSSQPQAVRGCGGFQ